jgi:hypothetical protein
MILAALLLPVAVVAVVVLIERFGCRRSSR